MKMHYNTDDGEHLTAIIRRIRPRWAFSAVMEQLGIAAKSGATLGQVMAAAERAMNNEKYITPAAIMFPENWEESKTKSAGNLAGPRLCSECATRFPADRVTKHPSGHGYICNNHQETA